MARDLDFPAHIIEHAVLGIGKIWKKKGSDIYYSLGNIGNNTTLDYPLDIRRIVTETSGTLGTGYFVTSFENTSSSSARCPAIQGQLIIPAGTANLTGELFSVSAISTIAGTATYSNVYSFYSKVDHTSTGTVTNGRSYMSEVFNTGGGILSTATGYHARVLQYLSGGTITTAYGGRFTIENVVGTITSAIGYFLEIKRTGGTITTAVGLQVEAMPNMTANGQTRVGVYIKSPIDTTTLYTSSVHVGLSIADQRLTQCATNFAIYTGGGDIQFNNGDLTVPSGNVGIGTDSPSYKLHVNEEQNGATFVYVTNANNTGDSSLTGVSVQSSTANSFLLSHGDGRTPARYGITLGGYSEVLTTAGNGLMIGTGALAKPIIFGTNNLERMRIDSSGRVGIGTDDPIVDLDVTSNNQAQILSRTTSDSKFAQVIAMNSDNDQAWIGSFSSSASSVQLQEKVLFGSSTDLWFATSTGVASGGTGNIVFSVGGYDVEDGEAMRIDENKIIGMGTDSPSSLSKLSIKKEYTDSTGATVWIEPTYLVTSNGSYDMNYIYISPDLTINSGVSVTGGGFKAINAGAYRSNADDEGSLNSLISLSATYGHHSSVSSSATTEEAHGLYITPLHGEGTIENSYGIKINSAALTGATVNNYWGVYQEDSSAMNYFAGKVGIGRTPKEASSRLEVQGYNYVFNDGAGAHYYSRSYRDATDGGAVLLMHARGTESSPTDLQVDDQTGDYYTYGWRNGAWRLGGFLRFDVESLAASAIGARARIILPKSTGGESIFWFNEDGSMVIGGASAIAGSEKLRVQGSAYFDNGTYGATISSNGLTFDRNGDSFITASDGSGNGNLIIRSEGDMTFRTGLTSDAFTIDGSTQVVTFDNFPITPSSAPTTDYQVANKKYVDDNAGGGFGYYDVIVDAAGGGDYTSIATALATEGANKSIFIKRGTYNETSNVALSNGQYLYFDSVSISFSSSTYFDVGNASNIKGDGKLSITGARDGALFNQGTSSSYVDFENLEIEIIPTVASVSDNYRTIAAPRGEYHKFNFLVRNFSFAGTATTYNLYIVYPFSAYHSYAKITLDTITCAQASNFYGLFVQTSELNSFNVIIDGVTTTTNNTGIGIKLFGPTSSADYNSIRGVSRNCDSSNLVNSGTGNNVAGTAV